MGQNLNKIDQVFFRVSQAIYVFDRVSQRQKQLVTTDLSNNWITKPYHQVSEVISNIATCKTHGVNHKIILRFQPCAIYLITAHKK